MLAEVNAFHPSIFSFTLLAHKLFTIRTSVRRLIAHGLVIASVSPSVEPLNH